jgi:iron complex outermembrane recepter protein
MKIKIPTFYLYGANPTIMQRILLSVFLFFQLCISLAQTEKDSAKLLEPVMVSAFEQQVPLHRSPIAVGVLNRSNSDYSNKTSMVSGFNTLAGVRMEERSPASYRINIRGSSLRSPFGVRNVKMYWNDIPVTDPGGNTYFNQFAFNNFSSIEIYKGPVSSMYGAGTGGLLLMQSLPSLKPARPSRSDGLRQSGLQDHTTTLVNAEYMGGSYNLQNVFASASFGEKDNQSLLTFAHNKSDGYRDHSQMRRNNASFVSRNSISSKQQLTAAVLFTDLFYETPGGLTKAEFDANPKAARPAAGGLPSAEQAKAAIYQKNLLVGIHQLYAFNEQFKNSTALYGAFAQIKNPTFRNYERRNEPHFGGRTNFIFNKQLTNSKIQLVTGGEFQQGYFNTQVSRNRQGNPDTLQTDDDIKFTNYSVFFQADAEIKNKLFFTAGISLNQSSIEIARLNKYPVTIQERTYGHEWSPRLALLWKFEKDLAVYGSVSKGFSPPTVAEVLPSTGVISTFLEAEEGINYELGIKGYVLKGKLYLELDGFYFKLDNALVVRKDSSNADYYVNAGNTKQRGIEFTANYKELFPSSFFHHLTLSASYTYCNFTYGDFQKENTNFTGNWLPGVPQQAFALEADISSSIGIYLRANCYLASKIFLNDANTAEADPSQVVGLRVGYAFNLGAKTRINLFTGADNLLDETYSLGNDINAAGGRYYNAAPKRNYYAGLSFEFSRKQTQ